MSNYTADIKQDVEFSRKQTERHAARSTKIKQRELEGRKRLQAEILELYGPVNEELAAKYRPRG